MDNLPRTKETYMNVTPIILELESDGMTQDEVIEWFKKNNPDSKVECQMYYDAINAGRENPLLETH